MTARGVSSTGRRPVGTPARGGESDGAGGPHALPRSVAAEAGDRLHRSRAAAGISQADLARVLGVSRSYLNLMERGRRPVAAERMARAARHLGLDPAAFASGPGPGEVAELLRAAEETLGDADPELRASDGRDADRDDPDRGGAGCRMPDRDAALALIASHPQWAQVIGRQRGRIAALSVAIERLRDPLGTDAALDAALHEVVSGVTALRATSAILAGDADLGANWRQRFHRNLDEDARRLTGDLDALVRRLDPQAGAGDPSWTLSKGDAAVGRGTAAPGLTAAPGGPSAGRGGGGGGATAAADPLSRVEAWRRRIGYRVPALEVGEGAGAPPVDLEALADGLGAPSGPAARAMSLSWLDRYRRDAAVLPPAAMEAALGSSTDPDAVAEETGCDLPTVLRRMGARPILGGAPPAVVTCDGAGALLLARGAPGFPVARVDPPCARWPLFEALRQPGVPLRRRLAPWGRGGAAVTAYAMAHLRGPARFGEPQAIEATMLVVADPAAASAAGPGTRVAAAAPPAMRDGPAVAVGATCALCAVPDCPSRRLPAVAGLGP